MTQRIEPLKKWLVFEERKTQIIEPFFWWLKELTSFQHDSQKWTIFFWQNWTLLFNMIHRNWTLLLLTNMTQSVSYFLGENMSQTIELSFWVSLKELNPFSKMTQRIELLFQNDSKNWTIFSIWLKDFLKKQLKESNTFFFLTTQRMQPFLNWIWLKGLNLLF